MENTSSTKAIVRPGYGRWKTTVNNSIGLRITTLTAANIRGILNGLDIVRRIKSTHRVLSAVIEAQNLSNRAILQDHN